MENVIRGKRNTEIRLTDNNDDNDDDDNDYK